MIHKIPPRTALYIALVSGLLVVIMSALMLLNYLQLAKHDPLESAALEQLVERSFNDPEDEALREEIRNLDLLARKAFFTSKWQIHTGSYILLFAGIVLVISLRVYYAHHKEFPVPESNKRSDLRWAVLSQRWILGTGVGVMVVALLTGYLSQSHLDVYTVNAEELLADAQELDTSIVVIEVDAGITTDTLTQATDSVLTADIDTLQGMAVKQAETLVATKSALPSDKEIERGYMGFRGPWGNGLINTKNPPVDWDAKSGKNVLWKTEIPKHGYNSPVIWADKLFVAGGDKNSRVLYCLNRKNGAILWERDIKDVPGSSGKIPKTTDDTGLSAASVCTNGQAVYVIFANGDLAAFDLVGNALWSKSFGVPDNHYGHSSSLITYKDQLFVQYDSNKGGKVFAVSIKDGSVLWETVRNCKISWASPIIAEIGGKKQLILASNPIVSGYDLSSGKELWSVDCMYGEVGPSAAYGSGLIFAANEYAKLVAIDPADNYKVKWENDEYLPEVSSPVVSEGLLFIATSYGVLVCYDAVNGDKLWEQEYNNGFYSSPVIVDGKLYAIDMDGVAHIIDVDRSFKLIAEPELGEKIVTTPAFTDGKMYIRSDKFVYCIGS